MIESLTERLKALAAAKGMSVRQLEIRCGFSNGYVRGISNLSQEKTKDVLAAFPDVNVDWLITGNGNMLKDNVLMQDEIAPSMGGYISALQEVIKTKNSLIDSLEDRLKVDSERLEECRSKIGELESKLEELQKYSQRRQESGYSYPGLSKQ